jgi:hypothetical protein
MANRPDGPPTKIRAEGTAMTRDQTEKLGSLFLVIFSTGLAAQLALDGMEPAQWVGAVFAVTGSLALTLAVRWWPQPAENARRD